MIKLFYNYYKDSNNERRKEIDFCFQKNIENKFINLIIIESQNRLTYNDFFKKINKLSEDEDINIICNSDIFFDDTIALVNNIKSKEAYALTRSEISSNGTSEFFHRPDSQDTWIVRGQVKNVDGDFLLGKRGCDNRIAYEFRKAGYDIYNPSQSIKTYHLHNSNIRTYTNHDVIPGPYLTLHPETIK